MSFMPIKWIKQNFLLTIIFLQSIIYVTVLFDIPVARQVISFLYLTLIPGLVLLILLKLTRFDTAETVLFSAGLSIAFLMLIGLFMNELYPLIGISQPLSSTPVLITLNSLILIGAILSCLRNGEVQLPTITACALPITMLSLIIIGLGIFGIFVVNTSGNSFILLLLLLAISVMMSLSALSKKAVPSKFYPLILFVVCISLLFFASPLESLVTNYLIGRGDQWYEYYAFKLIETRSYWDSAKIPSPDTPLLFPTYSMLSVTILPAIFSQVSALDGSWIFKIMYPLIVSFMALGTYKLYGTQTDNKTAFLAAFFFITISVGKGWGSEKQMVAQLFFVLLFLLFFDKKIAPFKRKILFILCAFGLVISHYSVSYLFIFVILFSWLSSVLINYYRKGSLFTNQTKMQPSLVLIYLVIAFSWGIFVNASESLNILLDTINRVVGSIPEFFDPRSRGTALQGVGIIETPTIFHQISTFIFLLTEFFIVVGFLKLIINRKKLNFDPEYTIVCACNLGIIAVNLLLPKLADTFLMTRFYQTTLILLAPLGILGGQTIVEHIPKINLQKFSTSILVLMVFTPLFLFQTGFIYEIAGVRNESLPLSMHRWDDLLLHRNIVETEEVLGATWLSKQAITSNIFVHSDVVSKHQVLTAYGMMERGRVFLLSNITETTLNNNEFIYLRYVNVVTGKIETLPGSHIFCTTDLSSVFENQNKIYSNGDCEIYKGYVPKHP